MSASLPPLYDRPVRVPISTGKASLGLGGKLVSLIVRSLPALAVIVLCLGGALTFSLALGANALNYTQEGGIIETLTVAFYGIVLVAAIAVVLGGNKAAGLIGLLALLMGLREMDAHKAFTTYGVFKTRLYVSPDVPLAEKLIAGFVVVALVVLVVVAIRASWRTLARGAGRAGVTLMALGAFGLFLKEVDGIPRQLRKAGMALNPDVLAISKALEEIGEMGLPILLGLALFQLVRSD